MTRQPVPLPQAGVGNQSRSPWIQTPKTPIKAAKWLPPVTRGGNVPVYLSMCILLVVLMFGAIWYLKEARRSCPAPLLLKLKTDYQMESAIMVVLQKIRFQGFDAASNSFDIRGREIAPGILLSLVFNRIASGVAGFDVRVDGKGVSRHMVAKAFHETLPSPGPASSIPEIVAAGSPQWRLEYIPEGGAVAGH